MKDLIKVRINDNLSQKDERVWYVNQQGSEFMVKDKGEYFKLPYLKVFIPKSDCTVILETEQRFFKKDEIELLILKAKDAVQAVVDKVNRQKSKEQIKANTDKTIFKRHCTILDTGEKERHPSRTDDLYLHIFEKHGLRLNDNELNEIIDIAVKSDNKEEPKEWVPQVGEWAVKTSIERIYDHSDLKIGQAFQVGYVEDTEIEEVVFFIGELDSDGKHKRGISYKLCRKALPHEIPAPEPKGYCIKRTPENAEVLNKWANSVAGEGSFWANDMYIVAIIKENVVYADWSRKIDDFTEVFTVKEFFENVGYKPEPALIAKAGEWVKPTYFDLCFNMTDDFGIALGKPLLLADDLMSPSYRLAVVDIEGNIQTNKDPMGNIKFEKCSAPIEHIAHPLWIHMNEQHNLLLLEGELHDIINIANEMQSEKVSPIQEAEERIPFDLEKWKTGKYDVVQRNGLPAEILKTDLKSDDTLVVVQHFSDGSENVESRLSNGRVYFHNDNEHDLFLIPKTETVWVNHFESPEYTSETMAINESAFRPNGYKLIETIEVKRPIK